ncbi:hypothetical protein CsSME_00033054 [Camellia sinensis var. sinensis]
MQPFLIIGMMLLLVELARQEEIYRHLHLEYFLRVRMT